MTTAQLSPTAIQKFFDNNGLPLNGGQLFTYGAGTTTPIATYVDSTGTTTNTNPIILNSRGECNLWLLPNTGYKLVLEDSIGNTIWSVDNIVNSQLITLFGGTDTGAANAYLLNFTWPYSAYANGELIYWVPSNTNTGPSTLNVNGLGVIPIVNINGTPLGAGQIVAGVMTSVIYYQGNFQLLSIGNLVGVTLGTFGTETPIASAATTDLGTATAHVVLITGSTTITSFGSTASLSAPIYHVRLAAALTLTYSTNLILPGGATIQGGAGDAFIAEYLGAGNWKVTLYQYATGSGALGKIKPADTVIVSSAALTPDPDLVTGTLAVGRYSWQVYLIFDSLTAAAGFKFTNAGTAVDSRALDPALASGFVNAAAYGPKADTIYATTVTYATVSNTANSNQVLYTGSTLISTPGTFAISWAQATSTATATTLRAGSYLVLNLLTTGTSANNVLHLYTTPGSAVETIPTGYNTLTIEVWGGGGGGGNRFISGPNIAGGGGGGAGAYSRTVVSVTGLGGDTLNYTVGIQGLAANNAGGASSVSSGTLAITTMSCGGGGLGGNATGLGSFGAGGPASGASGGTAVNTNGAAGAAGASGTGGAGGPGTSGIFYGSGGGGHGGGTIPTSSTNGTVGVVLFNYSV